MFSCKNFLLNVIATKRCYLRVIIEICSYLHNKIKILNLYYFYVNFFVGNFSKIDAELMVTNHYMNKKNNCEN